MEQMVVERLVKKRCARCDFVLEWIHDEEGDEYLKCPGCGRSYNQPMPLGVKPKLLCHLPEQPDNGCYKHKSCFECKEEDCLINSTDELFNDPSNPRDTKATRHRKSLEQAEKIRNQNYIKLQNQIIEYRMRGLTYAQIAPLMRMSVEGVRKLHNRPILAS